MQDKLKTNQELSKNDTKDRQIIELKDSIERQEKQLKKKDEYIDTLKKQILFLETKMKLKNPCEFFKDDKCVRNGS